MATGMFGGGRRRFIHEGVEDGVAPEYQPEPDLSVFSAQPNAAAMIPQGVSPELTAPMPQKKRGLFGQIGRFLMYGGPMLQRKFEEQIADNEVDRQYKRALIARSLRPDERWETVDENGVRYQRNAVTGEAKALPGFDNTTAPSGVREWEYMQSLPPEQREQFMRFRQPVPYQYTPQGIEAAGRIAAVREAAKPGKPTGGGVKFRYRNGIPVVANPADASALAPGTSFYDPMGNLRRVPGGN